MTPQAYALIKQNSLLAEFLLLYFGAPLAIALFLPPTHLFTALIALSAFGIFLLWRTGGFRWRSLFIGHRIPWLEVAGIALACFLGGILMLLTAAPEALFSLFLSNPEIMLLIWALYPLLSALPQELIFRPLFFHRYRTLLPGPRAALALNAGIFAFAHLMYWSWVVAAFTFIGGWFFARAYRRHGFPAAWLLHAVAGNILFLVGMGYYFYSGNVVRPF